MSESSVVGGTRATVIEEIPEDECRQLLEVGSVGRVAVVDGRQPVILPVNYVATPEGIIVHTDPGVKLDAGGQHLVAFEIDEIDGTTRTGWSVLVKGHAFDVTDTLDDRSERLRQVVVETWTPGERARRMMIEVREITGRRILRSPAGSP